MIRYNIIGVYDPTCEKLLCCKRRKQPYLGLYNFVGGKREAGESSEDAAYREMFEETGITREDIELRHFGDFSYDYADCVVEIWFGRLKRPVDVYGEENELLWLPHTENFFDYTRFAGEGSLGHIVYLVEHEYSERMLGVTFSE